MLPETLRLVDYGLGHDERALEPQPVASRLGPRFSDWQLAQSADESWRECHLHARNSLGEHRYALRVVDLIAQRTIDREDYRSLLTDPFTHDLTGDDDYLTVLAEIRARDILYGAPTGRWSPICAAPVISATTATPGCLTSCTPASFSTATPIDAGEDGPCPRRTSACRRNGSPRPVRLVSPSCFRRAGSESCSSSGTRADQEGRLARGPNADGFPDNRGVEAMSHSELLKRITVRPDVFGGKPIVRDMRLSVELILSLLAQGATPEEILDDYPRLEADDIRACIAYAHAAIADDTLAAVSVARR